MNKKQISSLVENFLNQARVTGLTLAHIGFSYTTLHNKKFAVSSHIEVLPSIGFGIPYYGSLTFGIGGEITVSNLPTSVKKVTINKELLNKMEKLADYGTFADDKFKVDEVKDKPVNEYFKDFSKAFVSTTDVITISKIDGDSKKELEGEVKLSANTNKGILIATHFDNIALLNEIEVDKTNLSLQAISAGDFGFATHYSDAKIANYTNVTNTTRIGPQGLTIAAFEIVSTNVEPAHKAKITTLKDKISKISKDDLFKSKFKHADLQDEKKVDTYIAKITAVETAFQEWDSEADATTKAIKEIALKKAINQFETDCSISGHVKSTAEVLTSLDNANKGADKTKLQLIDSKSLREKFHKTINGNIQEFYQDKANSGVKVNINSAEFNSSDKINTFLSNVANFNISMANGITSNVVMPYTNNRVAKFDLGAQSTVVTSPYFVLSQVETRRFSALISLYKGFNVNLNINKGIGDVIKGVSISAHISLSEYIKDSWKAKMYYNFFNTQKKERKTEKLDYNTAKEIAASIKDPKFNAQFKKVANADSSSASSSLKALEDRDWADVSGIEQDYENVLNVHSAGNKIGVTLYPYILNGDGINISFIIPALNISKLKDFWFLKLSYVAVLAGNPLCDDGVSIQSSYELDSESELTVA